MRILTSRLALKIGLAVAGCFALIAFGLMGANRITGQQCAMAVIAVIALAMIGGSVLYKCRRDAERACAAEFDVELSSDPIERAMDASTINGDLAKDRAHVRNLEKKLQALDGSIMRRLERGNRTERFLPREERAPLSDQRAQVQATIDDGRATFDRRRAIACGAVPVRVRI
ncbi:MAG TPA: hypothetical protein VHZ04_02725 [Candidatus Paceibacterota bacterium]|jgi:hypothetical protein|nr:hypothetical protein [Candidatus Paceibacterota bacterium]